MTTAEQYSTASSTLYAQGIAELDVGDLRQASEKLWGAAAQALKSVAEERGWEHNSHAHFYRIVRQLRDETDNADIAPLFNIANSLHVNFYEDWMDEEYIRQCAGDVRRFVELLQSF